MAAARTRKPWSGRRPGNAGSGETRRRSPAARGENHRMSKLSLVPRSGAARFWPRLGERLFAADRRRAMIGASACFIAVAVLDIITPAQLNLTFAYVSILM